MKKRPFRWRLRMFVAELRRSWCGILVWSCIWATGLGVAALLALRTLLFFELLGALFAVAAPLIIGRELYDRHQDKKKAKRVEPPRAWWVN